MGADLAVVNATDSGCVIQRDAGGGYVVSHRQVPEAHRRVATLPCAYATCRDWERSGPGDSAGLTSQSG